MPDCANIGRISRSFPSLRVASSNAVALIRPTLAAAPHRASKIAARREVEQSIELRAIECAVLTGSLHFDEPAFTAHHDIHVDFRADIEIVVEIEPE